MAPERLQGVEAGFVPKPYSAGQLMAALARELVRVRATRAA